MSQEHQDDLVETAQRYLPGGSTWMWTLPRDLTYVVDRAEGSHVMDTIDPTVRITADHDLRGADGKKATRLGHELIRRGVFVIPGAKMYISLAHTDADIERTLELFDDALTAL